MSLRNLRDKNDPVVQLFDQHRELVDNAYKEYKHQKELTDMEERILERLEKKFLVNVNNQASPVIKEMFDELRKGLNGGK